MIFFKGPKAALRMRANRDVASPLGSPAAEYWFTVTLTCCSVRPHATGQGVPPSPAGVILVRHPNTILWPQPRS